MIDLILSPFGIAALALVGGFLAGWALVKERQASEMRALREQLDITHRDCAREASRVGDRDNAIAAHERRRARLLHRMALLSRARDERSAALRAAEGRLDDLQAALALAQRESKGGNIHYAGGLRFRSYGRAMAYLG